MNTRDSFLLRNATLLFCVCLWWLTITVTAQTADLSAPQAATISRAARFDQNLGAQVPLDAVFRDESGQPVTFRSLLGARPAILVLGYHECPMLCSAVLGGVVETLTEMRGTTGKDFDLIDVSISPTDSPAAAAKQKRTYFKRYARAGADAGWHFLTTPDSANIRALSETVGFRYAYDAGSRQYAHPSGLIVLTPEGKVSRYFFGINYDAGEVQAALQTAAHRQVGSRVAELLLVCFHYNPLTGKYGALILQSLRVAGIVTLVTLTGGIVYLIRRPVVHAPRAEPAAFHMTNPTNNAATEDWTNAWLDTVVAGTNTMSQRKVTSVDRLGGGIETVQRLAKAKNVHLLLLEDDQGNALVAASLKPFRVLC